MGHRKSQPESAPSSTLHPPSSILHLRILRPSLQVFCYDTELCVLGTDSTGDRDILAEAIDYARQGQISVLNPEKP